MHKVQERMWRKWLSIYWLIISRGRQDDREEDGSTRDKDRRDKETDCNLCANITRTEDGERIEKNGAKKKKSLCKVAAMRGRASRQRRQTGEQA